MAASNPFANLTDNDPNTGLPLAYLTREALASPAVHAAAVTPSDGTDLAVVARALYVGGTGDLTLITTQGETVQFKSVPVGVLPVMTARVKSTGTTATFIVALW